MLLDEINTRHEGTYDFFYLPIDFKVGGSVVDYRKRVPPQLLRWISPTALLRHTDCAATLSSFLCLAEPVQRGLLLHQLPGAAVHPPVRAELRGPAVEKLQLREGAALLPASTPAPSRRSLTALLRAAPYFDLFSPNTLPPNCVLSMQCGVVCAGVQRDVCTYPGQGQHGVALPKLQPAGKGACAWFEKRVSALLFVVACLVTRLLHMC